MNTKKNKSKNKPRPVPVNPSSAQIEETSVAKSDDNVKEKPETVITSEERVPEIISEGVHHLTKEKDSEFDAPKKPKRNRGKKKKSDKTDDEEVEESQGVEGIVDSKVVGSDIKEEQKVTEIPNVTPTERKKKNKNKKHSESEDIKSAGTEAAEISMKESQSRETCSTQDILIKESIQAEVKTLKKKNKKKKRNDSEKSDKNEEVLSCTAAFQKILEPRDDKKDLKNYDKVNELNKPVEITSSESAIKEVQQIVSENVIDKKFVESDKEGKIKQGKEKKQLTKEDFSEDSKPSLELKDAVHTQEKLEKIKQSHIQTFEPDVEKHCAKPKAKIAKPVEKKQKGKIDQTVDAVITTQTSLSKSQEELSELKATSCINVPVVEERPIVLEIHKEPNTQIFSEKCTPETESHAETIHAPKTGMGKKRKKSPKPPQIFSDDKLDVDEEIKSDKLETFVTVPCESSTFKKLTSDALKCDLEKPEISLLPILSTEQVGPLPEKEDAAFKSGEQICLKVESSADKPDTMHIKDFKKSKNKKSPKMPRKIESVEKTEAKSFEPEVKDALKSDLQKPETMPILSTEHVGPQPETEDEALKSKEQICLKVESSADKPDATPMKDFKKSKNKKSPKMPRKIESVEKTEAKSYEPAIKDQCKEGSSTDISDIPTLTPLLEDIEITSLKAEESEGSISDIIPDIQYPRASSLDNNNNIIIRDITAEFTENLNVPVNISNTPLITGSGETPITTPDEKALGIKVIEIKTEKAKPSEEKTDLKSKVMEVNQDMEVLRQSIEKSLAELTAIEKSEEQIEKSFEDSQNKTENKNIENKIEDVTLVCQKIAEEIRVKELKDPIPLPEEKKLCDSIISTAQPTDVPIPPVCPARKDNKGKGKSKKKGKQDIVQQRTTSDSSTSATTESSAVTGTTPVTSESKDTAKGNDEKVGKKDDKGKGKQQSDSVLKDNSKEEKSSFEPIENFEDAMTSSATDVNKSFEIIANEDNNISGAKNDELEVAVQNNPEINVTAPTEDDEKPDKDDKVNPVSQPKNLLGRPNIPVRLNKTDYKKEKHKTPNARQARVNIKDSEPIDKESKESQTEFKRKFLKDKSNVDDTMNCITSENEEFVYKYSFRKVFLPSACFMCKKELKQTRVPCNLCNLVFYCSQKHRDEDYAQHQGFCFAVSTIVHLKNQKHIYADSQNVTGHDYRLLRMQMIVSCEKVLKRKLTPYEQEILLYPRICADTSCREWRQSQLKDCDGCGQISFCTDHPDHLPKTHQRWCKSYSLYQKLVTYQQTRGRLEPRLPARVMVAGYRIPPKINEVLASMYEEKIDMNDMQYAALTQVATAPLTAAYCHQLYTNQMNSTYANGAHKKSAYTLHVVGAELQFEADALHKWEVFFLHLRPDLTELRVVLIGHELNPSNLPLDLLSKIRLCENCRQNKRRVIFDFQDGKTYQDYWSTDFLTPDLVCAFNPSIQRSSIYNGKDHWASAIKCILKLKVPFVVTSYTLIELHRDLARIKEVSDVEVNVISEPNYNSFASVRPDRNFISDDEMPLLFKNYCFMLISGVL